MNLTTRQFGRLGEHLAVNYLSAKGYGIIQTNYQIRDGEIDIICRQANRLIFVEVKARRSKSFGWPEEAFARRKQARFLKAVQRYIRENDYQGDWQIDVIALLFKSSKSVELKHYQAWELENYQ